jgi:hypothetical protein
MIEKLVDGIIALGVVAISVGLLCGIAVGVALCYALIRLLV